MITEKQKKQKQRSDILFILISSFIVVVAWIAFNIYHIYITSTISQTIQLQLLPISPLFDAATMQQLKTRESVVPQFNLQQGASGSAAPTPTTAPLEQPSSIESLRTTPTVAPSPQPSSTDSLRYGPTNSPINRQGQ